MQLSSFSFLLVFFLFFLTNLTSMNRTVFIIAVS